MYQKTNAMSEIKRVNKDNFWAKAEVSVLWSIKCLDLAGDCSPCTYSLSGNWDQELREVQSCCFGVLREEVLSLEGEGAALSYLDLAQDFWGGLGEGGLGCTLAVLADS